MKHAVFRRLRILGVGLSLASFGALEPVSEAEAADPSIQFNRDIRPILTDSCVSCHGFDGADRKANLRLDTYEGATAVLDGRQAIKPGDLNASELWRRVNSTDPKIVMPPPEVPKKLTAEQIALLGRWIQEGAVYQKHWAFEPAARPEAPVVKSSDWARDDLDRFVLKELEKKGISPAAEAPREVLIRRVSLDLTGLPPTVREVEEFLSDHSPEAYERVVDRLLASPRYGEHMARYWLDVARYGDTHGLHLDNERSMWPYRDWVVTAFNDNLPFDQFTIWQLAGDLLPDATREQKVASGFNRCNVSTSEGGAIDEEFQVRYAVDRVDTVATAWMGLTMGCAACHDHKLDPITQKEFYQMFSIFNNIAENAMDGNALLPPPTLKLPSPEQEAKLKAFDQRLGELDKELDQVVSTLNYIDPASLPDPPKAEPKEIVWVDDAFPKDADVKTDGYPNQLVGRAEGPVFSGERALQRSGAGLHQVYFSRSAEDLTLSSGDRFFVHVYLDPKAPPKAIMLQFHSGGWGHRANWGDPDAIPYGTKGTTEKVQVGALPEAGKWVRLEVEASVVGLKPGARVTGLALTQVDGSSYWDKAGLISLNDPAQNSELSFLAWQKAQRSLGDQSPAPKEIKDLLKKDPATLEAADAQRLLQHFLRRVYADPASPLASIRAEMASVREKRQAVDKEIVSTMISKELEKPRPAWVLLRGEYDKKGEPVGPGVPAVLPPLPPAEATNRLTFAKWLVDPAHPLTARVTVNRFWQQFFGVGIVKTAEDFGTKGDWPSHPELLDWLATEFTSSGWDVKKLVRRIVTSASYRQDSSVTPQLLAIDPENRLLGRGPRHRLDAEQIRDNALFTAGLLNLRMGGRGVRTYQPPGIWEAVGYTTSNTAQYTQDSGDALYRRSLYLFWKRTAPPPSMTTFDAPSREQCRVRRERTNTPLQALLTMNDVQFFEAARHLGYRMLREGGGSDADRLSYGFRLVAARPPSEVERGLLAESLDAQRSLFQQAPDRAQQAVQFGDSPAPAELPAVELAAYTMVANLLLNLDEVLTKN